VFSSARSVVKYCLTLISNTVHYAAKRVSWALFCFVEGALRCEQATCHNLSQRSLIRLPKTDCDRRTRLFLLGQRSDDTNPGVKLWDLGNEQFCIDTRPKNIRADHLGLPFSLVSRRRRRNSTTHRTDGAAGIARRVTFSFK
jgi:hypothetical protein